MRVACWRNPRSTIFGAIVAVAAGKTFCSPQMVHSMFGWLAESAREAYRRDRSRPSELTPRELEVLRLIEEHLSNKQIARRLPCDLKTAAESCS